MLENEDNELSDEVLIARCKAELPFITRSYELLVQRHMNYVYTLVYRMIPNREDAEDIAQDIFIKVYHTIETFDHQASFSTWLYRVTVNSTIDALHKMKRRKAHFFPVTDRVQSYPEEQIDQADNQISSQPGPEERLLQKEQRECINRVLQSLDREQARVLIMRDIDDLSYSEIAAQLNTGLSAAKMRIHRARLAFQHFFLQFCEKTRLAFAVTAPQQPASGAKKGKRQ